MKKDNKNGENEMSTPVTVIGLLILGLICVAAFVKTNEPTCLLGTLVFVVAAFAVKRSRNEENDKK